MFHSTTILSIRHRDRAVMAGDGQVTFGQTVVKQSARKIRRLYNDRILAGFAGSAADSFALFARFEAKLEQFHGNLSRAAVELAKDWRTDRSLRQLEAVIEQWTSARTTAEIVELATLLRVPVAEVGNGATLPQFPHLVDGGYCAA